VFVSTLAGFEMVFEEVPASQIESLSEAFATSTTKVPQVLCVSRVFSARMRAPITHHSRAAWLVQGVMPITEIDGKKIGDGAVGPIVTALMKAFDEETLAPSS
jgi:hypothetical protein